MRFDAMFEAVHRAEVVYAGLAGWSAAGERDVGLGVVEVHAEAAGGVGKATGRHAEEHGVTDSPRYLIAVHRRSVLWVDDWLHPDVAGGVDEEPAYVSEGDRSYSFESADSAA